MFRVEPTIKFKVERTIKVHSPIYWNFRVERTIKFKVETFEQKSKKVFLVFLDFFKKDVWNLKTGDRQERVNIEEERTEKWCESESRELWRAWIFTVIAPNCYNLKRMFLWCLLVKLILRRGFLLNFIEVQISKIS